MRAREPLRKHTDVMLLGKFAEIGCCESSDRQISAVGDARVGSKSKVILASWKCLLFKSIQLLRNVALVLRGHVLWIPCSYLIAPDALWP